jgi:hypothetical protein
MLSLVSKVLHGNAKFNSHRESLYIFAFLHKAAFQPPSLQSPVSESLYYCKKHHIHIACYIAEAYSYVFNTSYGCCYVIR